MQEADSLKATKACLKNFKVKNNNNNNKKKKQKKSLWNRNQKESFQIKNKIDHRKTFWIRRHWWHWIQRNKDVKNLFN